MKYEVDTSVPFPLAYLDWCKAKGIENFEETENHSLVMEFGKMYTDKGGKVNAFEIMIARGDKSL